jgi:4-cresol dehydrogenase (hydroxylating)
MRIVRAHEASHSQFEKFLAGLAAFLKEDQILSKPGDLAAYERNVSGFSRAIPLVVKPRSVNEVQKIVVLAGDTSTVLYPISRGANWGLGSRLPLSDEAVIVDLSDMNQIRLVDEQLGYAVLEPGVTQGQLAEYLRASHIPFFLDVTGSGVQSSIIGNAMERGVAYHSQRCETVLAYEMVLGSGELLKSGFLHDDSSRVKHLFSHGIGPSLTGLCVQSNFGIVTSATIQLHPKPEYLTSFVFSMHRDEDLIPVFETLQRLRQQKAMDCIIHVANRFRKELATEPLLYHLLSLAGGKVTREEVRSLLASGVGAGWTSVGSVMGKKSIVKAQMSEIKKALKPYGRLLQITDNRYRLARLATRLAGLTRYQKVLESIQPSLDLTRGIPSDAALRSIYWPRVDTPSWDFQQPDQSKIGILFCAPLVPLTAFDIQNVTAYLARIEQRYRFKVAITLNMINAGLLEGVLSIDFDLTDAKETARAHECIQEMNRDFLKMGYSPYRMDIESMRTALNFGGDYWQIVGRLKKTLDPAGVIAPGRYSPL